MHLYAIAVALLVAGVEVVALDIRVQPAPQESQESQESMDFPVPGVQVFKDRLDLRVHLVESPCKVLYPTRTMYMI